MAKARGLKFKLFHYPPFDQDEVLGRQQDFIGYVAIGYSKSSASASAKAAAGKTTTTSAAPA